MKAACHVVLLVDVFSRRDNRTPAPFSKKKKKKRGEKGKWGKREKKRIGELFFICIEAGTRALPHRQTPIKERKRKI